MQLPGTELVRAWVPVVLRLTWRTPPGFLLACLVFVVANEGWLGPLLGLTRSAEVALGILAIAIVLWLSEALPLFVTSLLVLALELAWLAPTFPHEGHRSLFLNAFFSDVSLLFLGGFVLSAALGRTALDRRLARAILRRAGKSPRRVLLATMLTTTVVGMWMSNTAACALMLGLAGSMLANVPRDDGFRKALLLGIAFSANVGGISTPIGTPPNAIMLRYLQATGNAPSFLQWVVFAMPLLTVLLALVLALLLYRFPTQLTEIEIAEEEIPPIGAPQLLVIGVLVVTVAGWVAGDQLGLSAGTVALVPVVVFFGTNLLKTSDLRGLPWDVLLLIGGGLALGAAIEQSGLAQVIGAHIPASELSTIQLLGVASLLSVLVSSMMSSTATANVLAPLMLSLSGSVELTPLLVVTAISCSLGMPLPVSTPPNAMVFAFSQDERGEGGLTARDMLVPGALVGIFGMLALIALAALWLPVVVAMRP